MTPCALAVAIMAFLASDFALFLDGEVVEPTGLGGGLGVGGRFDLDISESLS